MIDIYRAVGRTTGGAGLAVSFEAQSMEEAQAEAAPTLAADGGVPVEQVIVDTVRWYCAGNYPEVK